MRKDKWLERERKQLDELIITEMNYDFGYLTCLLLTANEKDNDLLIEAINNQSKLIHDLENMFNDLGGYITV